MFPFFSLSIISLYFQFLKRLSDYATNDEMISGSICYVERSPHSQPALSNCVTLLR